MTSDLKRSDGLYSHLKLLQLPFRMTTIVVHQ